MLESTHARHYRRLKVMPDSFDISLETFDTNGSVKNDELTVVEGHFNCILPQRYKAFMVASNGGEGFLGKQYLILWRATELIEFNRDYEVAKYAPDLLLFGSNGGGEAFGFDLRECMTIRMVPFVGMSSKDAVPIASDFDKFLSRLNDPDATLP